MPLIRPQLSKGSLEKMVEAPVNNRNSSRRRANGCRWNFRPSTKIFTSQTSSAARKAVTAPLVASGAQSANAVRQKKRAASSQPARRGVAVELLAGISIGGWEHTPVSSIRDGWPDDWGTTFLNCISHACFCGAVARRYGTLCLSALQKAKCFPVVLDFLVSPAY